MILSLIIKVRVNRMNHKEYQTDEYFELDLPAAPAVMVGDEIVIEGSDVPEDKLEGAICKHLGLPAPEPKKKGILGRFFTR